ncbi:MAG TPA: hypothetical protein VNT77_02925 [Allosphingosinicella sp.]|nr:hypothetical protein [Allosphingosinicella sp.]
MANQTSGTGIDTEGLSGSELQQSQAGSGSGQFGGNRDQRQGGEARASDMDQAGGSSGTGGYGKAQNQQNHQGQQVGYGNSSDGSQSRGERFDEEQGGGRSTDTISTEAQQAGPDATSEWDQQQGVRGGSDTDDFQRDQQEHQDRGQSVAEAENDQG